MFTFWLVAAALVFVISIALIFVMPPLLRRMQRKPPAIPGNSMARLLSGPTSAIVVGLSIPALAIMLYLVRPDNPQPPSPQVAVPVGEKMAPEHAQVIEDMAARLEQNPDDGIGWSMLAQSYAAMGRYADSVKAFEKATNLIQNDPQLLVDYADVLAVANDRTLFGKPLDLINQALKMDPNNIKGLALIGTAAFQSKDYAGAVKNWEKVIKLLPPNEPLATQMTAGIAEARAMIAGKKSPSFTTTQEKTSPAKSGAQITGVLILSPDLTDKVSPTDTVFLSAKDVSGSPAPIAVMRAEVKDLPLKFTLDDSMSMMPEMKLSNFQAVLISAKISRSGNTKTQPGDLHGEVASVKVGENDVRVVIDKVAR